MRFKIDENLPGDVVEMLGEAGHDAVTVLDQGMGGQSDASVSAAIVRENRVLVTLDLDFADIRAYPPEQYPGLLFCEWTGRTKPTCWSVWPVLFQCLITSPSRHGSGSSERGVFACEAIRSRATRSGRKNDEHSSLRAPS